MQSESNRTEHQWGGLAMLSKSNVFHYRRALILVACLAVLFLLCQHVVFKKEKKESKPPPMDEKTKFQLDSAMAMSWEGFGPEKGVYNFTVVTSMFDIGRGNWDSQSRPYNVYLLNMQRVLRLDVNIIAFVDAKARPFVDWMRRGREARTRVVVLSLQDLPYYAFRDRVQEIMKSDKYRKNNELVRHNLCESKYPDYNILQWSKLYFINEAIELNPFQNDFFFWLDGGYGHGNDVHPHDGIWRPQNIFEFPDKVTFIQIEPIEQYRDKVDGLHKLSISVIAGLFFAGGKGAMQRLYKLQQEILTDWFRQGITDDDQTVYMLIYFKHPDVLRLMPGTWYDVFKLFHSPPIP